MARFPVLKIEPLMDKNTENILLPNLNEFGLWFWSKNSLPIYIRIQMFFALLSVCSCLFCTIPHSSHIWTDKQCPSLNQNLFTLRSNIQTENKMDRALKGCVVSVRGSQSLSILVRSKIRTNQGNWKTFCYIWNSCLFQMKRISIWWSGSN